MSKTLMSCFFLLAFCALVVLVLEIDISVEICNNLGIKICGYECLVDKVVLIDVFSGIGVVFLFRAKRTMRDFLLILMGTYNAILEAESKEAENKDIICTNKDGERLNGEIE